jgi:aminobenzoyl-glutamate transport protein
MGDPDRVRAPAAGNRDLADRDASPALGEVTESPRKLRDRIEAFGNALPDPVLIFVIAIAALVLMSVVGAASGWSVTNPVSGQVIAVESLLSEELVQRIIVEMPSTYAGFPVLGMIMLVMLGAGVAERSGLFTALIRTALQGSRGRFLTPSVLLVGMLSTHAGDTGYLVYVPLVGIVYAAAGRHPLLGIATAFAGVGVGLSGNLLPGQYDIMLLGLSQTGAHFIDPQHGLNPLGNWWFSAAVAGCYVLLGWWIADRVVAQRLGSWSGQVAEDHGEGDVSAQQRLGLRAAGVAGLIVVGAIVAATAIPGFTPLRDEDASAGSELLPFYDSLVAGFFLLFLASGWAYGRVVGTIRSHRDVVGMMVKGIESLAPYIVLVFFAAQFVAMFRWSNLGPITAIKAATALRDLDAPVMFLLPMLTAMTAWFDFVVSSGSAKWTAMAPVAVPMLMLLGVSPEMTTAAYRLGDTVTNLISPLNPYFVLTLTYCQRWMPQFGLGSLLAVMIPFSVAFYLGGVFLTVLWIAVGIDVGPGASVNYAIAPMGQ